MRLASGPLRMALIAPGLLAGAMAVAQETGSADWAADWAEAGALVSTEDALAGTYPAPVPPAGAADPFDPEYIGVETRLLDQELVNMRVAMRGARDLRDIEAYALCAAAQYALIRGYGFARHVRTNVNEQGGIWRADAIYTISPALPRGMRRIDAEVVTASCLEQGIPTV